MLAYAEALRPGALRGAAAAAAAAAAEETGSNRMYVAAMGGGLGGSHVSMPPSRRALIQP
jgi:hypothetical protein